MSEPFYGSNEARSMAFHAVPETCPVVRKVLSDMKTKIALRFSLDPDHTALEMLTDEAFELIVSLATKPLRHALIDAEQKAL